MNTRNLLILPLLVIVILMLCGCILMSENISFPYSTLTSSPSKEAGSNFSETPNDDIQLPTSGPKLTNTPSIEYAPTEYNIHTPTANSVPLEFSYNNLPNGIYVVSISNTKLIFRNVSGTLIQILDLGYSLPGASYSKDRNEMIFASENGNVNIFNLNTLEVDIFDDLFLAIGPTWVLDGSAVIYTSHEQTDGFLWSSVIYMYHLESSNIIQITDETINANSPQSSPDGKLFAFLSDSFSVHATQYKLILLDSSCLTESIGSSQCMENIEIVTDDQYIISSFSWSPDGTKIAMSCFSLLDDISGVCLFNLESKQIERIYQSERNIFNITWSPDGEWIGMTEEKFETSGVNVALIHFDGSSKHVFESDENESVLFWITKD